ncbi:MAG: GntR family transcriptional regulator [Cyclobacteriaceae bacterium]|nr:GntR family transcriptional regulator [Cyclobacteriaceae bacterium]
MAESDISKLPQHRKLYELLRKHIVEGNYPEGSMLSSENELCSIHQVTRPTVRQALSRLEAEGYIVKRQGKGSIVRSLPKGIGILSIQGTTSGVGKHNLETRQISKPEAVRWPEDFPFELSEIEKESGCVMLERSRILDGSPVLYEISFIPNINIPRFTQKSFENKSLFDVMRTNYGIEVTGGQQKIMAISATESTSQYLQCPIGAPILKLLRKIDTNRHGYSFYSTIYCNTSDFYLEGSF